MLYVYHSQHDVRCSKSTISIELYYPAGKPGEKVVVAVPDGGSLDNGKVVKVLALSNKRIAFQFKISTQPGVYRLHVYKGEDTKVIQPYASDKSKRRSVVAPSGISNLAPEDTADEC